MEKTKNRIIIENPPKKVLDFVMKVQKEKEEAIIEAFKAFQMIKP